MDRTTSFGYWIRRRRKALDLTQDALAQQAGYATATIKKIEADERRPSRELAERLAELLKITPEERTTFLRMARAERASDRLAIADSAAFSPRTAATVHPHNLPAQMTALIGRQHETAALCTLLRRTDVRLVTLSGPGGIGKTRLALNVASELLDEVANGVYVVALAPISDPALVAGAIAQALGLHERGARSPLQQLKDYLRDKQLVLLLDNFEQIVDAAPLVAELLAAAPQLTVLITSRMLLRLSGEHEVAVPPLALPDHAHAADREQLLESAAVQLFVARAQAIRSDFAITNANAPAIAEICQRLDGLPLAIELAAARIKLFPPQALLARLRSPLALLTVGTRDLPQRQQTLRATLDWSYDLLNADEQALFARLAVFVGGCTLEAVEAVCGDQGDKETRRQGDYADKERGRQGDKELAETPGLPGSASSGDVLDTLSSLVDQSLVQQELQADGEPRFTMLATIREYALERLELSGEAEALRRQHAAYFVALVEAAEPKLRGSDQEVWWRRLEQEFDNVRAVLRWAIRCGEAEIAQRLSGALWWFWEVCGHLDEGRRWSEAALTASGMVSTAVRAQALLSAGLLARPMGDSSRAQSLCEESLALWRELGDTCGIADALGGLATVAYVQGDYERARALAEQSLALLRETDNTWGIALALCGLGCIIDVQGDYTQARALYDEGLALFRELGDKREYNAAINNLGMLTLAQGDYTQAQTYYAESLALARSMDDKPAIAVVLNNLGGAAYLQGDYAQARAYYEESLAIWRELGERDNFPLSSKNLGLVALAQGEPVRAHAYLTESLAQFQEQGNKRRCAECLEGLAGVATVQAQPARAARLWGAAEALRAMIGAPMRPIERPTHDRHVSAARAQLDEATFAAAWANGRALTIEQVIAYALTTDESLNR